MAQQIGSLGLASEECPIVERRHEVFSDRCGLQALCHVERAKLLHVEAVVLKGFAVVHRRAGGIEMLVFDRGGFFQVDFLDLIDERQVGHPLAKPLDHFGPRLGAGQEPFRLMHGGLSLGELVLLVGGFGFVERQQDFSFHHGLAGLPVADYPPDAAGNGHQGADHNDTKQRSCNERTHVALSELAELVAKRWRAGFDGFVVEDIARCRGPGRWRFRSGGSALFRATS